MPTALIPDVCSLVSNVQGEVRRFNIENKELTLLQVDSPENSYVASPYGHYINYAKEMLKSRSGALKLIDGLGMLCRGAGIHRAVYLNNSLFSTDLIPYDYDEPFLDQVKALLNSHYPEHPLIIRSLVSDFHGKEIKTLKRAGFKLIAMRQILYSDPREDALFSTRIIKSDMRQLEAERLFLFCDAKESDIEEMLALYNALYLQKHSTLSPHLTHSYLKRLIEHQLMRFVLYRKEKLLGFAGYWIKRGVMHVPLMGYDLSQKELYRILNSYLLVEARKNSALFHQSSGAKTFKTIRRAKKSMEYMAVYTGHLTTLKRFAWDALGSLINGIAPPLMRRF